MRICFVFFFCLIVGSLHARKISQKEILDKINPFIESHEIVGLSLYLIQDDEELSMHFGEKKRHTNQRADNDSFYDIASITKIFTGTVLAKAILEGRIHEDDLAQNYLNYSLPTKNNVPISILDLATHRSGFSQNYFEGVNFKDRLNPWASFGLKELINFFERQELEWIPGTKARYDNIGSGILGDVLEKIYNKELEQIYRDEITRPMGMDSTKLRLNDLEKRRAVQAYALEDEQFIECPMWTFASLAALGGLKSNTKDMAQFARFIMKNTDNSWAKIIDLAQRPRRESLSSNEETIGLLWRSFNGPYKMYWHNGGTYGMSSFIAINKAKKAALILLANNYSDSVTGLGFNLMRKINE